MRFNTRSCDLPRCLFEGVAVITRCAVIFQKTSTGYSAYVPDLPGCVAAADSLDATRTLIEEAVAFHIATMREDGESIPEPTTLVGTVAIPG